MVPIFTELEEPNIEPVWKEEEEFQPVLIKRVDEHLNRLYFLYWIPDVILDFFLYIFLAYFRLIWLFCRYTDKKWWSRWKWDKSELKWAFLVEVETYGQQAGTTAPAIDATAPTICLLWKLKAVALGSWGRYANTQVFAKLSLFRLFWSPRSTQSIKNPSHSF